MGFWQSIIQTIGEFLSNSGFATLTYKNVIMLIVAFVFLYLAIKKKYEPLLLVPISFGMLLANLPRTGLMEAGGLLDYLYMGDELGIFPPLIFMGIGALTDFGPLIANPKSILLGAAAQFGIFVAFWGALLLGYTPQEAASIGIIGGADGPTAIWLSNKLAPHMLAPIAVAAYSYMSLVPIIQPPIMRLLTTPEERKIRMPQLREVSKREKILFPIVLSTLLILIIPDAAPLIGMFMFGNLLRECEDTKNLAVAASTYLMYIVVIFLGITVGATATSEAFLNAKTLGILFLGLVAFSFGTAGGVLFGKLMCKLTGGKINPLIGAAGVSAVPMSARIAQKVATKEDPYNFILMQAMGPNIAGVIGSAVVAGILFNLFGK